MTEYYNKESVNQVKEGEYMNCGIPQGLPQSYFFGNLCMIEVQKRLMKDDFFKGDAYFYVDDSVIYIQSSLESDSFKSKISALNNEMEKFCKEKCTAPKELSDFLTQKYIDFQSQIEYTIRFHEEGKSSFCHIDNADNHLGGFENLARETSMASNLFWNLDEIDETISYKKCKAISEVVDKEIRKLKEMQDGTDEIKENDASRLKMLKRFKKFYLYRVRMLNMKAEETSTETLLRDFDKRFSVKSKTGIDLVSFFETNEEEIFQSEYRLLIENFSLAIAKELAGNVKCIEERIFKKCKKDRNQRRSEFLYYQKDVMNSIIMKSCSTDPYLSLKRWVKEEYKGIEGLHQIRQFNDFSHFLVYEFDKVLKKGLWDDNYMIFILNNSSEYQRRILNAYYSESIHVLCSDACSFIKSNSKKLHYTELRILIRLRNRQFNLNNFRIFVKSLNGRDVSNQMGIDMALLSVIDTFVSTVRDPEWVDGLVQTHRITKGLWYNGSKFLNSYTLHNEEHAVTLINQSVHIVKTIDYFVLKPIDYYILFLSCYLHDISMVIHPDMYMVSPSNSEIMALISEQMLKMQDEVEKFKKVDEKGYKNARLKDSWKFLISIFDAVYGYFENRVRNMHPSDSADFVLAKSDTLLKYLEPTLLSFVAKVSASHGWDVIDVYGLKSRAKNDIVGLKYLMILIRLADLFDVANDRVNYHLLRQNLNNLSLTSQFHWISHLVTDKLVFDADYETSDDNNSRLDSCPITETLIVKLYLNVKYLTSREKKKSCEGCLCSLKDDHIDIDIVNKRNVSCKRERCTLLCRWMMLKHEWMVNELIALKEYLYSVNNSLVRTKIKFQLYFSNEMDLDADLFDCVVEYLDK